MTENVTLKNEKRSVRAFSAKQIFFVLFWGLLFFVYANIQTAKQEPILSFGSVVFFLAIPLLALASLYVVTRRSVLFKRAIQSEGAL
jgi:hypothetical protein